ncbi:hypothetical protein SAMN02910456_00519 [Ruminococcaceae bacterium YRB3002]|nr:hypothetical protein SAMN02910456_00519 [Ruminococcaceae bacterium YRB3002]
MAYKLAEDIVSGNAPDMMVLNSNYAFLSNDRYLMRTDDNTYRYAYARSYNGLIVRMSLLKNPASIGITYGEYKDLIESANNGINVMGTRIDTFNTLFRYSAESFFDENGHVDLHCEEFRLLSEFVSGLSENLNGSGSTTSPVISLAEYNGLTGFIVNYGKYGSDFSIIGLPSADGSSAESVNSEGIAICSCSSSPESCADFIRSLSTPEVQSRICFYQDPSTEEAVRMKGEIIINERNYYDRDNPLAGPDGWPSDVVDHYLEQVSDAVIVPDVDTTVLKILDEELQPYLEGQKSFEEFADIAENRINLMVDER